MIAHLTVEHQQFDRGYLFVVQMFYAAVLIRVASSVYRLTGTVAHHYNKSLGWIKMEIADQVGKLLII